MELMRDVAQKMKIGRILHLKSEIRKLKLNGLGDNSISVFGSRI
jgi:hypothetical protein